MEFSDAFVFQNNGEALLHNHDNIKRLSLSTEFFQSIVKTHSCYYRMQTKFVFDFNILNQLSSKLFLIPPTTKEIGGINFPMEILQFILSLELQLLKDVYRVQHKIPNILCTNKQCIKRHWMNAYPYNDDYWVHCNYKDCHHMGFWDTLWECTNCYIILCVECSLRLYKGAYMCTTCVKQCC